MLGKFISILLIIGLIALSTKLIIGLVRDIKNNRERKNAKFNNKKEIEKQ